MAASFSNLDLGFLTADDAFGLSDVSGASGSEGAQFARAWTPVVLNPTAQTDGLSLARPDHVQPLVQAAGLHDALSDGLVNHAAAGSVSYGAPQAITTVFDDPAPDNQGQTIYDAGTITVGSTINDTIAFAGDQDWFQATLHAGQSYLITENPAEPTPLADPYLSLYDATGALVTFNDDGGPGAASALRFTPTADGVYYIGAADYGDDTGIYQLSVTAVAAQDPLNTISGPVHLARTTVNVYLAQSGETYHDDDGNQVTASDAWSSSEMATVNAALAAYAGVTPLQFHIVTDPNQANIVLIKDATLLPDESLGYTEMSAGQPAHVVVSADPSVWYDASLGPGGLAYATLLQQIGEAIGLDHPEDDGGGSEVMEGVTDTVGSYGSAGLNQGVFTVMSGNHGYPLGDGDLNDLGFGREGGPMALDIAALQRLYGSVASHTGDDTFVLPSADGAGVAYMTIWDTAGVDAIAASGSGNATIDLRPATLLNAAAGGGYVSQVAGVHGGLTIAAGVIIENGIGAAGNDLIMGNDHDNWLVGGAGDDTLIGGAGADHMVGGTGNDVYSVTDAGDVIIENPGEGIDTVYSSISLTLAANVENLILTDGGLTGIGNALDNTITGTAGDDVIIGGAGNDHMIGGAGNDVYEVTDAGDVIVERAGEGTDTVYSTVNITLSDNVENLYLVGAGLVAHGNALNNMITGTAGDDVIIGGAGNDHMIGGAGNDTYEVTDAGDVVVENPGEGIDTIYSSISLTMAANVENLFLVGNGLTAIGNASDNTITGTAGNDVIIGGAGIDHMIGGAGNDVYEVTDQGDVAIEAPGGGVDSIYTTVNLQAFDNVENLYLEGSARVGFGNALNNTIIGTVGDDLLYGQLGSDTLTGGAGADTFLYNAYEDSLTTNPDHITDFQSGVDHLDLRSLHTSGADKVSTQIINGSTYLYIDRGGDGTNDFLVVLDHVTAPLAAGDYLF